MLLNRMTLFLELLFCTESIREEVYFQPFLREHTLQGETGKKQQELLLSVTLGLFTKCKGISCSGKKLRFTSILTSYCLRTAAFSLLGFFTYGSEEPLLENPCFPSTEDTSGKISPGLFGTFLYSCLEE